MLSDLAAGTRLSRDSASRLASSAREQREQVKTKDDAKQYHTKKHRERIITTTAATIERMCPQQTAGCGFEKTTKRRTARTITVAHNKTNTSLGPGLPSNAGRQPRSLNGKKYENPTGSRTRGTLRERRSTTRPLSCSIECLVQ